MERAIEATILVDAPLDAVGGLLRDPLAAIGTPATLTSDVGTGPTVHRDVMLTLGPATRSGDAVTVPVGWRAAAHETLFPAFEGELTAERSGAGTRLRLTGIYTVPLGALGRFGDGVLGRRVAHESVRNWLAGVARRLDGAVADGEAGPDHEVDLVEPTHSELYIG